ncbi:MAG: protease [Chitinophagaceae bacterium]|nr:protease [Chitinophagaceae bacterium]
MKLFSKTLLALTCLCVFATSCKRESVATAKDDVSSAVLQQIAAKGFSTEGVRKVDNGYLVEGDIVLTNNNLTEQSTSPTLLIANDEQYRTTNLVTVSGTRTVTVSVSGTLTSLAVWSDAANAAIARYNALPNRKLTFLRITSGTGNIDLIGFDQGPSGGYITLGSSGFPSGGNPYNQIKLNTNAQAYGSNPNLDYVTSVIQHEMGHCIGFRHTDYFNRALSCGGAHSNERAGSIGAVLIPGTPSGFDAESFMLACSNGGNRPFNANDKIAMAYLYDH